MHTPNPQWTAVATGGSTMYPRGPQSAWRQVVDSMRTPVWPLLLASVCAAGLLMAFQQVVHAGVVQGEARNKASAAYSHELWRCDFERGVSQRATCHAQLQATRHINAMLDTPEAAKTPAAMTLAAR